MTEDEARDWLHDTLDVPRGTIDMLARFADFLRDEAGQQNLVAASTLDHLWLRHIVDSAQLLLHVPPSARTWVDLGAGAGFPGMVIAALGRHRVTLIEARRMRIDFLRRAAIRLGIEDHVEIIGARVESVVDRHFDIISARAFAPLERLLPLGMRFVAPGTRWLLPKGRNVHAELDAARGSWQGAFEVVPSITDPEAGILIAGEIRPRKNR